MAEFSPQELDQLEDALEDLEGLSDLAELDLAEPLRERLHDYQNVLRASREALPMEEVPEGLLDGVLAEARAAESKAAPERPGLWKRWRAALIPVFALAGTTAAVLWIVRPDEPMVSEAEAPAETAAKQAPGAAAPAPASDAAATATETPGTAELDAEQAYEAVPAAELPLEESMADDAKAPAKPSMARKSEGKPTAQAPAPEPTEKTLDKDGTWELIEAGHQARRRNDCDSAVQYYRKAEKAAWNNQTRAAAWMGLGLCEEMSGVEGSEYLENAKAADPNLATAIERERASSRKVKPAPKKKSKMRMPDEAAQQDPFPGE